MMGAGHGLGRRNAARDEFGSRGPPSPSGSTGAAGIPPAALFFSLTSFLEARGVGDLPFAEKGRGTRPELGRRRPDHVADVPGVTRRAEHRHRREAHGGEVEFLALDEEPNAGLHRIQAVARTRLVMRANLFRPAS